MSCSSDHFLQKQRYRTIMTLAAVRLDHHNDKPERVASIPKDAIIQFERESLLHPGMVNVLWGEDRYAILVVDLENRAIRLQEPEAEIKPRRLEAESGTE